MDDGQPAQLKRSQSVVLISFIVLQVVHALFMALITSMVHLTGHSPWEQIHLERVVGSVIVVTFLLSALRGIRHRSRWAWGLVLILAVDASCFAGWYWRYEEGFLKPLLALQLVMIPVVLATLVTARRIFGASGADIVLAGGSVILGTLVIFLRATYFPTNQIDWAINPPFYFELLVYSNFHWPQEQTLALLMVLYLAPAWIRRRISGWRGPWRVSREPSAQLNRILHTRDSLRIPLREASLTVDSRSETSHRLSW